MLPTCERFAQVMEHLCFHDGDDGHGYTQDSRWGDGTYETITLSDGSQVRIQNGDRDCSSAIISALEAVGVDCHGASYTGNMKDCLLATGLFAWYPMNIDHWAQRGDIYLNEIHHTAMCTSSEPDMMCQFSISENGTIYGQQGDQTGNESNFRAYSNYYNGGWDGRLCWIDREATGNQPSASPSVPEASIDDIANAVINGVYGDGHERRILLEADGYDYDAVQSRVNAILGMDSAPDSSTPVIDSTFANYWGAIVVRRGDKGKAVMLIQNALSAKGYDLGNYGIDGDFGSATDSAVRSFQRDNGLVDDGEVGIRTAVMLFA